MRALSRVRRFWQVHPGAPNLLSTAGSFAPPVGGRIDAEAVPGYYIDFTIKADFPRWPAAWLEPKAEQLHVATAQFGLGCIERHLAGDGDEWLQTAIAVADHLVSDQAPDGGWVHGMPMPHSYWLEPPWLSAMAQGEGASVLTRIHQLTGEDRYAEAALRALEPMRVPVSDGGVRAELDGGFFPEEYPSDPSSYVLNGAIFALWGCRDVARTLGDAEAGALYDEGIETLAANLHRYDSGFWSLYDLFPHPVRNVASGAYHQLHLTQLQALQLISPRPEFENAIKRFADYQRSPWCSTRATTEKVVFRLLVPRNDRLALRLPWSHRPDHGEVLVLCYHAVSDEWPSRLAVTTAELRRQLGHLVERGYHGVTFSEAVTGPPNGKRVAVTFDDGYASLTETALPILSELGLPGTVFVPTSFAGLERPMEWTGIDRWMRTGHESELEPLDWEQIRSLGEAGWEIGSHTRTHPRLTGLDDDDLASELGDSRVELERRLGQPCRAISYPYGDVDERVISAARDAGYVAGAALPTRFGVPRRLAWPRVGIYRADQALSFGVKVSRVVRWLRATPMSRALAVASKLRRRRGGQPHT
jgi:peptidoglycan/xylan/chitin deacetylase (PgdA/CDA1 family)